MIGARRTSTRRVTEVDLATSRYPDFVKPPVLATARLVEWCERAAMEEIALLRQYFPKGTDLSDYTQAELDAVADELNNRPRQTLNWKKPTEVLNKFLVEAG